MASIQKRGNVWRAQVARRGERINGTFDTRSEAEDWAIATEAKLLAGVPRRDAKHTPTMADLFHRYSIEVSPTKGGARWERIRLATLAADPDFACPATEIGAERMAAWRDKRLQIVSALTVNRELTLISAVFTFARKEWRVGPETSPVRQITRPTNPRPRTRRVSDDELVKICDCLGWDRRSPPTKASHWVAWAYAFAVQTAMRKGEILGMTWDNAHPRHIHLPTTKNGDARNVPLNKAACALLALLPRGAGKIVRVEYGTADALFRRARDAAGLKDLRFHDARREGLTRHSKKLRNVLELAAVSGHRSLQVLKSYYAPEAEHLADILDGED